MIIEVECNDLSYAMKTLMHRSRITYRELANNIGEDYCTVWRAIKMPDRAMARVLFKIVKAIGMSWEDFEGLYMCSKKRSRI